MKTNSSMRDRAGYVALLILLLAAPLLTDNAYFVHVLILMGINVMLALSLRLVMTTGQVNFGQAGFMLIGAYTSAVLVMKAGVSFWLALILSSLLAMAVAIVVGYPTLKIKGVYFFIITFAMGELLGRIIRAFPQFLGGVNGLAGIPAPDAVAVPGLPAIDFGSKTQYYYLMLALLLVTFVVMWRFERSRIGKTLGAIGTNDSLAQSLGINLMGYKVAAFAVSCLFAGLAGSFDAHYLRVISPATFNINVMIFVLTYVIVGGQRSIWGPVIGTAVMMALVELLRVTGGYQVVLFAVVLIAVVILLRGGLVTLPELLAAKVRQLSFGGVKQ